ncbi:hypothetical protein Tco_1196295 [Tanacetum coccineum]
MLRAILKDDVDMSENDLRYTGYIVDATDGSDDGSKQTALGTWQNGSGGCKTGTAKITDANDLPARLGMYPLHVRRCQNIFIANGSEDAYKKSKEHLQGWVLLEAVEEEESL